MNTEIKDVLKSIQGYVLVNLYDFYRGVHTPRPGEEMDYEDFYDDLKVLLDDIHKIDSLDNLYMFCQVWGLNDNTGPFLDVKLSFSDLTSKFLIK